MVQRKRTARGYSRVSKKARYSGSFGRKMVMKRGAGSLKTARTVDLGTVTVNTADQFQAIQFKLEDLPGYSEFTVFDEYRITGARVIFVPDFKTNVVEVTSGVSYFKNLPHLITAIDNNDATTPTKNDLLENESCIIHENGVKVERFVKPCAATTFYQGALATGYGTKYAPWLDVNSSGIQHYGLKFGIIRDSDAPAELWQYRIFVKFFLEFKKTV